MPRNRVVRRSGGFGRRSPGRLTEWFGHDFAVDTTNLAAATFVIQTSLSVAALAKRPFTITRTVGELFIQSDQNAAIETVLGAMGGIVVSEKAIATGATAVPDPVTQVGSDEWFLYQSFAAEGSASTNVGRPMETFSFDSRAQRRVQDGEDIAFVIANASAADGLNFIFQFRMLIKLS